MSSKQNLPIKPLLFLISINPSSPVLVNLKSQKSFDSVIVSKFVEMREIFLKGRMYPISVCSSISEFVMVNNPKSVS